MPVSVTDSVPEFVTVDSWAAVAPSSMSFEPNARESGLRESSVWMPVPLSATVTSAAFELTVSVADFPPVLLGSNCARTLHVCPAVSVVVSVQSVPCPVSRSKWAAPVPPSVMPVSVTDSVPEFVTVDSWAAVAPSSMSFEPNARESGLRESSVWMPVPLSATVTSAAFELTVSVADFPPVLLGSNCARTLHVCPAVSVVVSVQSVPVL